MDWGKEKQGTRCSWREKGLCGQKGQWLRASFDLMAGFAEGDSESVSESSV